MQTDSYLGFAAEKGNIEMVKLLLSHGATLEKESFIVKSCHVEVAKLLIAHGADPDFAKNNVSAESLI